MTRSEIIFGIVRIPLDFLVSVGAFLLAYQLRVHSIDLLPNVQILSKEIVLPPLGTFIEFFVLPWSAVYIVILGIFGLYALRVTTSPWKELASLLLGTLLWLASIITWFALIEKQLLFSRILIIHATSFACIAAGVTRVMLILLQRSLLRRGIGTRSIISCGNLPLPMNVLQAISDDARYTYAGHLPPTSSELLKLDCLPDLVLHTDPNPESDETQDLINACRSHHIGYAFLPPVLIDVPHLLSWGRIGLVPMLRFQPTPLDGWGRVVKRGLDTVGASALLVLLSPLLLFVSALILCTSGWPIFYVSTRVGQYGRERIPILKFRTMCRNADALKQTLSHMSHRTDGPLFKIKNDPRITPLGRLLRRTSIDELPQLFNAIVGHVSLVGPRPHLPEEVAKYSTQQRRVFAVRPGITGLAQVSGRSNLSFDDEVRYDMRYIEEWSIALDCWILWRTVFVVLFGKGAD